MLRRTNFEIDPKKYKEFLSFIKKIAKDGEFWEQNKKEAATSIDQKELDSLFDDLAEI